MRGIFTRRNSVGVKARLSPAEVPEGRRRAPAIPQKTLDAQIVHPGLNPIRNEFFYSVSDIGNVGVGTLFTRSVVK